MNNFTFQSATKIIFGRDTEQQVGAEVKKHANRILLHYGGGSIKKSGLYDRVTVSLKENGVEFIELAGVQPNPRVSLVRKGIQLCRDNNIPFILLCGAVNISPSYRSSSYTEDVWDFYTPNPCCKHPAAGRRGAHTACSRKRSQFQFGIDQ